MRTMMYKDGMPIGEREVPDDLVKKAREIRVYMALEGISSFCGLTDSLSSHLKIQELEGVIANMKTTIHLEDLMRNQEQGM